MKRFEAKVIEDRQIRPEVGLEPLFRGAIGPAAGPLATWAGSTLPTASLNRWLMPISP
ncbi:MAG TPA: hypothetical protein VLY63_07215 [Anaerolineae bacterium]|nr:hypothetical protein [Anaerolineae bacterium]